jgi:cytochrome c oxidase assembly factor CtaG
MYNAALANTNLHVLEHASFFITALCFWWAIWYDEEHGGRIIAIFAIMMASGLMGALITFAPLPWYAAHAQSVGAWGLTPLEDQQLAGLFMWIPGGTLYIVVAALLLSSWLNAVEQRNVERERRLSEEVHRA